METGRYAALLARASRPGCFYVPEYRLAYMKEMVPEALGRVAALHIAAMKTRRPEPNPFLDAARGSLGSALLDPYSSHAPLAPRHPALNGHAHPETPAEERDGAELGLRIFRALVSLNMPIKKVLPLFEGEDQVKRVLDWL